mmetsp:Transcript_22894/g.53563  ORF Transcript_22894/g.53563 Transcript_22894/m.53563 type:complete len:283 (-) Transcript_22894:557-1405(-)
MPEHEYTHGASQVNHCKLSLASNCLMISSCIGCSPKNSTRPVWRLSTAAWSCKPLRTAPRMVFDTSNFLIMYSVFNSTVSCLTFRLRPAEVRMFSLSTCPTARSAFTMTSTRMRCIGLDGASAPSICTKASSTILESLSPSTTSNFRSYRTMAYSIDAVGVSMPNSEFSNPPKVRCTTTEPSPTSNTFSRGILASPPPTSNAIGRWAAFPEKMWCADSPRTKRSFPSRSTLRASAASPWNVTTLLPGMYGLTFHWNMGICWSTSSSRSGCGPSHCTCPVYRS